MDVTNSPVVEGGGVGSPPTPELPRLVEAPADRACGEPGEVPTSLPPGLEAGRTELGSAALRPGDRTRIGPVDVHYDAQAWIGTRSAGHRAPAIDVVIDRSVHPVEGAWGRLEPIVDGSFRGIDLAGLHVEGKATKDGVMVTVSREACPAFRSDPAPTERAFFWLDAHNPTRQAFNLESDGGQLEVRLQLERPEAPLQLFGFGPTSWNRSLALDPASPPELHAVGWGLRVEEVVAHEDARHQGGGWVSKDGKAPKISVRFRLERQPSPTTERPVGVETSPCGEPRSARLDAVPAELGTPASPVGSARVSLGKKEKIGPYQVAYRREDTVLEGRWLEKKMMSRFVATITRDDSTITEVSLSSFDSTLHRTRAGRLALQLRPVGSPDLLETVEVDLFEVACLAERQGVVGPEPLELWLSTRGAHSVTLNDGADMISLSLAILGSDLRFSISDGRSSLSFSKLDPTLKGTVFDLHTRRMRVLEIVPDPETRFEGGHWRSDTPEGPIVHLRVALGQHG